MKKKITFMMYAMACFVAVNAQTVIDSYLSGTPKFVTIGNTTHKVAGPTDLDFNPSNTKELWVSNYGGSAGGSNVIFTNPGEATQKSVYRKDVSASHFIRNCTGMSMGDMNTWCSSQGGPGNNGSAFMGPSLWPSDPNEYAVVNGPNGSHLDMLHQSQYGLGVEAETKNIFYYVDGYSGHVVKYDFKKDHGPGNDDHSDGQVFRYSDIQMMKADYSGGKNPIPNHCVLDKVRGILYVIDGGNKRVLSIDTKTGSVTSSITPYGETLAAYKKLEGASNSVYISGLSGRPVGLEYYKDRLLVTDYESGDILVYDASGTTGKYLGTIKTSGAGTMGIKVGPDEKIYYVNYSEEAVYRIDPNPDALAVKNTEVSSNIIALFPNPSNGIFTLGLTKSGDHKIEVYDALGQLLYNANINTAMNSNLDLRQLPAGVYVLTAKHEGVVQSQKITIVH